MPTETHTQATSTMGGKMVHARKKSAPSVKKRRKYVKKKMEYWNKKKRK